jgi:hypothetical protein
MRLVVRFDNGSRSRSRTMSRNGMRKRPSWTFAGRQGRVGGPMIGIKVGQTLEDEGVSASED